MVLVSCTATDPTSSTTLPTEVAATASPVPVSPGARLAHPHSATADPGVGYPFRLSTHCGLDFRVDFDGSFWQLIEGSGHGVFDNPEDRGTMTLLGNDVAQFRSDSGATVQFVRYPYPWPFEVCD